MRGDDIKRAFDKITLSTEQKNLITNSILENREIRTAKKVRHVAWKQALQVCLLVVLCAMVVAASMVLRPAQGGNNAALAGESEAVSMETEAVSVETEASRPEIPDEITFAYIVNKMMNSSSYYTTFSGKGVKEDVYSKLSATIDVQYNSQTSEYYEHYHSTHYGGADGTGPVITQDLETYCDGTKTLFYNNERKNFKVIDCPINEIDIFNKEIVLLGVNFSGLFRLKAYETLPITDFSYSYIKYDLTITKYLDRDCAVLTRSFQWKLPDANTLEETPYQTTTEYYYVDILTGLVLNYEWRNEAGEVIESFKFTEVKIDEDLNVKTVADAGGKYDDYRKFMAVKENLADHTAIATQTVGNLQITMEYKYRVVKGDVVTVKTTVKNIGSEPVSLWAPSIIDGVQGCVSLSAYRNGKACNFGLVVEEVAKPDEIFFGELQPGESFTREDVFDTNQAEEMQLDENDETSTLIEVRGKIYIHNGDDFASETVITELAYTPFYR
ncbi:MAG TPA: hypothetical protein PLD48_09430 [Bacillota bacterium]|nr:hypothetical protein [Bacillota bacterium]HOK68220.1 hypothetical protein [Bacillota bacterium]HPP85461.1 hypothetical protein [Bacillota bacterium]